MPTMIRGRQSEPSQGLIRRFSDEISKSTSGEPLGRALAAKVAIDENRERLETIRDEWDWLLLESRDMALGCVPDEEAVLFHQSQRLHTAWSKFQRSLPEDQRMQLVDSDRPDINFLMTTVKKASTTWKSDREESKLGKLKSKFQKLCQTCQDHSSLLAILPKDDKYVTLLTGSISAIAQATINHQNIAEGVADTIDDLNHDIDFWNRQMMEHGNIPALRPYIQELYIVVFEFFTEIFTKWSKSGWKRFLTSFDSEAVNKLFTSKRNRLQVIEHRMERHINLDFRHRTTKGLEKVIETQEGLLNLLPAKLGEQRLLLGEALQLFLEQQQSFLLGPHLPAPAIRQIEGAAEVSPSASSSNSMPLLIEPEIHSIPGAHHRYSRTEIQTELKTFATHWMDQVNRLIQIANHSPLLRIDKDIHRSLNTWLRDLSSTNIWIHGPHGVSQPSQNSLTAVSLAALARTNNIPCIIYFCALNDTNDTGISKDTQLRQFLISIVTQLVQLIPDQGHAEANLSPSRFAALAQGDLDEVETLQLIRDVRSGGPKLLYGFIDNLQALEDRSNKDYTRHFLRTISTLCGLCRGNATTSEEVEPALGTKICFTTDGYVDGLAQAAELKFVDRAEFELEVDNHGTEEVIGNLVLDSNGGNN